jgi:hypothetical protein
MEVGRGLLGRGIEGHESAASYEVRAAEFANFVRNVVLVAAGDEVSRL